MRAILAATARLEEWKAIAGVAEQSDIVFGAVGIHPFFVAEAPPDLESRLREHLTSHHRLRAVGEIGLDFFDSRETLPDQMELLRVQLRVAQALDLPVLLHNRKSWNEFLPLWKQEWAGKVTGICHNFTASVELARQLLDAGLFISFCGPVTYSNARNVKACARFVPLDRLLTETDTPDLPAEPYRHNSRSEPSQVRVILDEIAAIRHTDADTVAEAIWKNAVQLLRIE